MRTSTTSCWCSLDFDRVFRGHQFILTTWGMNLEWQEEKLAEEQAQGLYSFDGRDLSVELEELHERVAGVERERTAEVMQLSWSVMEISDALVDQDMFPIRDIPSQPRSTQDVLTAAGFILERLREKHASGAGPWVQNSARPMLRQPQAILYAVFSNVQENLCPYIPVFPCP
jgi:hypothetical protein